MTVAQATQAPADLPRIRVRSGVHPDYTRLVFDWENSVPYEFNQDGGIVTIRFGRAANIDVGRLASNPPRMVGGVRAMAGSGESTVAIAVPANATVRHFLSGPKVVVDVREPADGNIETSALPEDVFTPAAPVSAGTPQDQGADPNGDQETGQDEEQAASGPPPSPTPEPAAESVPDGQSAETGSAAPEPDQNQTAEQAPDAVADPEASAAGDGEK